MTLARGLGRPGEGGLAILAGRSGRFNWRVQTGVYRGQRN